MHLIDQFKNYENLDISNKPDDFFVRHPFSKSLNYA